MKPLKKNEESMLEIGRYEKQLLGRLVIYSLFVKEKDGERTYGICISCGEERESCILNGDLFLCVDLLRRIVNGDVFPYSLYELVEDFWAEQKI